MTNVSAYINAEVTSDGTGLRVEWLGCTKHLSSGGNGVITFPNHCAYWARVHVLNETWEECFLRKIGVVFFKVFLAWSSYLHGHTLEALLLEAGQDLAHQTTLHTVWLDHDEGSLFVLWLLSDLLSTSRLGLFFAFLNFLNLCSWFLFFGFSWFGFLVVLSTFSSLSLGFLLFTILFICLLLEELLDSGFVVGKELNTIHIRLQDLGDANALCSLVVLHNTAHGALSCAHCTVEHVNI